MAEPLWRRVLFPSHRPQRADAPRVLAITTLPWDEIFYKKLRATGDWDFIVVRSVHEALSLLTTQQFSIVVCDRDLPGSDWRDVLAKIVESSPRSCFLLASRVSDEYLWREVVAHGGYDVVVKPLEEDVVVQTLHRAWYYWQADPPPQNR
jgi:DNA-binding NtrC family response regulator